LAAHLGLRGGLPLARVVVVGGVFGALGGSGLPSGRGGAGRGRVVWDASGGGFVVAEARDVVADEFVAADVLEGRREAAVELAALRGVVGVVRAATGQGEIVERVELARQLAHDVRTLLGLARKVRHRRCARAGGCHVAVIHDLVHRDDGRRRVPDARESDGPSDERMPLVPPRNRRLTDGGTPTDRTCRVAKDHSLWVRASCARGRARARIP